MIEKKVYAIGDIHGCGLTLQELVINICELTKDDTLFLLGDLIDRGPRIKFTIDFLLDLIDSGYDIRVIRGNHEEMLLKSINFPKQLTNWYKNGGKDTLDSFELMNANYLEDKYINFFFNSKYYYKTDNFVLVHSGLNFNIANPFSDINAMLFSRDIIVNKEKIGGRRLITGHTPRTLETVKQSINTENIWLDGGCVYSKRLQGMGYLCAFELNSNELFYIKNIDF